MIDANILADLEKYTGKVWHRKMMNGQEEMLYEHLLGTYHILKTAKKPEYLCLAGLYHAVYETEYFKFHTPYTREHVKELIGEQAEELVYEFSKAIPRVNILLSREHTWSDQVYADLIDIELANMAQQYYTSPELTLLAAIRKHLTIKNV